MGLLISVPCAAQAFPPKSISSKRAVMALVLPRRWVDLTRLGPTFCCVGAPATASSKPPRRRAAGVRDQVLAAASRCRRRRAPPAHSDDGGTAARRPAHCKVPAWALSEDAAACLDGAVA